MNFCPRCQTPVDEHPANRCLDALIAEKVMGWSSSYGDSYWIMSPPEGSTGRAEGRVYPVSKYSTFIKAAMEVVEKWPAWTIYKRWNGSLWYSTCLTDGEEWYAGPEASTVPHAICRAALKAIS